MKSIQNCHLTSSCAVRVGDARGARQHVQHDSDGPATRTDRAYPDRQTTPLGVSRSGYSGLLGSEGFPPPPRGPLRVLSRLYAPDDSAWWSGFSASDVWRAFQRPDLRLYHAVTAPAKGIRPCQGPDRLYGKPGVCVQENCTHYRQPERLLVIPFRTLRSPARRGGS